MPETQWLANFGIAAVILFFAGRWLGRTLDKLIDKIIPLFERYVTSTENLHVTLQAGMADQRAVCSQHVTEIAAMQEHNREHHDCWKRVASSMCAGCREVIAIEKPTWADVALRHCDEIDRCLGET